MGAPWGEKGGLVLPHLLIRFIGNSVKLLLFDKNKTKHSAGSRESIPAPPKQEFHNPESHISRNVTSSEEGPCVLQAW
jgi:hypothetical protein